MATSPLGSALDSTSQDRLAGVHVWAAQIDLEPAALAALCATLSESERERAARFHFERHRNRFIAARGFLRRVLSAYLQTKPRAVEFDYGPHGKPALTGKLGDSGLHFNLTHSADLALLAVTRAGRIGIDVERVRPVPDADTLVARFFSHRENTAFHKLPAHQQPAAFFNLWTRKEAWLKATGEGITRLLHQVEVSFLPDEPARLLSLPEGSASEECWSLHHLDPALDFVGAVAIGADKAQVDCRAWNVGEAIPDLRSNSLTLPP